MKALPSGLLDLMSISIKTGQRVGSIGRHRLVLESIRPLQASDEQQDAGSVTAQQLVAVMKGKTLSYQASRH